MAETAALPAKDGEPDVRPALPPISADELLRHVGLFVAAAVSMIVTYAANDEPGITARASWVHGGQFAGALLTILLAHEMGHYVAARLHRVDSSLPFFIPLPLLSPFGTMGAVIRMKGTIPSRSALLDIGASGPLCGLVFAIPFYAWGIHHSPVRSIDPTLGGMMGESLLSRALDAAFAPPLPPGTVQVASPVLFAAWAGLFVTMLNLLPIGQLDGGHVAYALLGKRQNRAAVIVHRSLLAFFFVSLVSLIAPDIRAGVGAAHLGRHVNDSIFWLFWFEVLAILGTLTRPGAAPREPEPNELTVRMRLQLVIPLAILAWAGRDKTYPTLWAAWFVGLAALIVMEVRGGVLRPHSLLDHPDVGDEKVGTGRKVVAIIALLFFVALFMPTPMSM